MKLNLVARNLGALTFTAEYVLPALHYETNTYQCHHKQTPALRLEASLRDIEHQAPARIRAC